MDPLRSRGSEPPRPTDEWKNLRQRLTHAQPGEQIEHRRAEDRIREEHHDSRAKTIYGDKPVEQRRDGTDTRIRERRQEQQRQWDRRQTVRRKKTRRSDP